MFASAGSPEVWRWAATDAYAVRSMLDARLNSANEVTSMTPAAIGPEPPAVETTIPRTRSDPARRSAHGWYSGPPAVADPTYRRWQRTVPARGPIRSGARTVRAIGRP